MQLPYGLVSEDEGDLDSAKPVLSSGASSARRRLAMLLVGMAAMLLVVPLAAAALHQSEPGVVMTYTIPDGARQRVEAGETLTIIPDTVTMRTQDKLVIVNNDSSPFEVGGMAVAGDRSTTFTFSKPGVYTGKCELHASDNVSIVVL